DGPSQRNESGKGFTVAVLVPHPVADAAVDIAAGPAVDRRRRRSLVHGPSQIGGARDAAHRQRQAGRRRNQELLHVNPLSRNSGRFSKPLPYRLSPAATRTVHARLGETSRTRGDHTTTLQK